MKKSTPKNINLKLLTYNLSTIKAYFAVYTIILFISYPLTIIIAKINRANNITYDYLANAVEPYALIATTLMLALVTPFIVFSYLNSKKSIDVYHALPVKRSSLFSTNVMTSLLLVLIPFTLNFFLGYAINAAFKFAFEPKDLLYYFFYIVTLIAIHGIPLFVIMNTGTTADGLIHTGILILLPFVAYAAFNTFFHSYVYGVGFLPWENYKYLTPLFAVFQPLTQEPGSLLKLTFYWMIISGIIYIASLRLYTLRKSEKAEEPFVNEKYFPIVTTMFIPLFFILMNVTTRDFSTTSSLKDYFSIESFVLPFGIAFVGYMILNFFRYRSTKYFMKTLVQYLVIMIITSAVSVSIIVSDGFGAAWRLPKAQDIESISFTTRQLHNINSIFTPHEEIYENYEQRIHLIDSDTIEKFLNIHSEMNQLLKSSRFERKTLIEKSILGEPYACSDDYDRIFSFTYHLKNGRNVEKELSLPTELITNFAQIINEKNYQVVINPILNIDFKSKNIKLYNNIMSEYLGNALENDLDAFRESYFNDLNNLSSDDLMFKPSKLKYIIRYQIDYNSFEKNTQGVDLRKNIDYNQNIVNALYIDERFPETIKYLESKALDAKNTQSTYAILAYDGQSYMKTENQSFCGLISHNYFYDDIVEEIDNIDAFKERVEGSYIRKSTGNSLYINGEISLPLAP